MKKLFLIIFLLLRTANCFAQGIDNLWLLGYGEFFGPPFGDINMDFYNGVPNIYSFYRPMEFHETNAEVCDKQGNLLFYSNGYYIANALDDTMQNGSGINPSLYTSQNSDGLYIGQGNLIIPFIDDTLKYYLFHETAYYQSNTFTYQPHELYYSIIDMSLDSGKGAVFSKNNILISDTLIFGELTAVKHANGRDWWLIFHKAYSQLFYKYLITPAGIAILPDTQTIANMYYAGGAGQCAFSPDGNWYAHYQSYDDLTIMQFDRCTGIFSNPTFLAINDTAYSTGIAFSPDSKKVYASSFNYVYQFLLDSPNIAATKTTVAVYDSFANPFSTYFYMADLAHDGKIYLNAPNGVQYLHVIDQPNQIGVACNVIQHGVLLPSYNAYTIPNFPNYFLGPVVGSICDSLGLGIDDNIYKKNLNLRINPNPAQNSFYLNYELPTGKDATLYVYNTLGKMVYKQRLYSVNKYLLVHCDAWQQGMYYLKVVMDKGEFSANGKVVIIR